MGEIKNCHPTHFFQNFELFAITDSDELSFSNLYFLDELTNTDIKLHTS